MRALRNCKAYKTKSDLQTTMLTAADLIESLTAQLAKEEERRRKQAERLHAERSQKYDCFDVISDLKEQLAASPAQGRCGGGGYED